MLMLTARIVREDGLQKTIRDVISDRMPTLSLMVGQRWHLFLSHTWASGQDQCAVIKRQSHLMLPGIRVFLE